MPGWSGFQNDGGWIVAYSSVSRFFAPAPVGRTGLGKSRRSLARKRLLSMVSNYETSLELVFSDKLARIFMKGHRMKGLHWIAIPIAVIATFFGWVAPPGQSLIAFVLFALAFIVCFAGLAEAVNRCANALEKRN